MHKGRAEGGPRDGIILTGPPTWDGRVRYPDAHATGKSNEYYYPGHYEWMYGRWVWRTT